MNGECSALGTSVHFYKFNASLSVPSAEAVNATCDALSLLINGYIEIIEG